MLKLEVYAEIGDLDGRRVVQIRKVLIKYIMLFLL
jgi:hypothetical protein